MAPTSIHKVQTLSLNAGTKDHPLCLASGTYNLTITGGLQPAIIKSCLVNSETMSNGFAFRWNIATFLPHPQAPSMCCHVFPGAHDMSHGMYDRVHGDELGIHLAR